MKRFIAVFLLLFFMIPSALGESFDWYATKHFLYSVPSGWQGAEENGNTFYFGGEFGNAFDGYLLFQEHDLGFNASDPATRSLMADSASARMFGDNPSDLYKEEIDSNCFSLLNVGTREVGGYLVDVAFAISLYDQHALAISMINCNLSRDDLIKTMRSICEGLVYLPGPVTSADTSSTTSSITDILHAIGKDVYDERFRDAFRVDSSGYLFVDSDAGYASNQRVDMALLNAKDFLAQLRPYLDSGEISFKEINFRTHLECVDNYGNVEDVKVLSFWFTFDDVLKMKFETMPLSGLRNLALNWYQHPVLQ